MSRIRPPNRRPVENFSIHFANVEYSISVGFNAEGRVVEVFISTRKAGTPVDVSCRDTALMISLCLQYGCPLEVINHSITKTIDGKPEGLAGFVLAELIEVDRRREEDGSNFRS